MKFIRKILILLLLIGILFSISVAKLSKHDVYKKLLDIYGNIESVSLDFNLVGNGFSGNLIAKKGNNYKMEIGERIIICNGKTIWNYSPKDNKVVISDFEKERDNISLEDIFFTFIKNFEIDSLTHFKDDSYLIRLKTMDSSNFINDISEINLKISKFFIIQSIQIIENSETLTWQIKNLNCTNHFKDNEFEFKLPKNCSIIDLR